MSVVVRQRPPASIITATTTTSQQLDRDVDLPATTVSATKVVKLYESVTALAAHPDVVDLVCETPTPSATSRPAGSAAMQLLAPPARVVIEPSKAPDRSPTDPGAIRSDRAAKAPGKTATNTGR